ARAGGGVGGEDGAGAGVADAVTRRAASRHDRDLAAEPPVVPGVEIHARLLAGALNATGRIRPKPLRVKPARAHKIRSCVSEFRKRSRPSSIGWASSPAACVS